MDFGSTAGNAVAGTIVTWGLTALGSAVVFIIPESLDTVRQQQMLDVCMGVAGGVMLAASFWSLLAPALDLAEGSGLYGKMHYVPVGAGFLLGGLFCHCCDVLLTMFQASRQGGTDKPAGTQSSLKSKPEGKSKNKHGTKTGDDGVQRRTVARPTSGSGTAGGADTNADEMTPALLLAEAKSWRRVVLLVLAITIHNFPEGIAVGVGFGAVGHTPQQTLASAWALAFGIGVQNVPEGFAVSLPLYRAGMTKWKAFLYGQLSGVVEPFGGLLGAMLVIAIQPILPYALAFAAGAMVFVVVDEMVPESHKNGNARLASLGSMIGFVTMMSLDVALG